MTDVPKPLARFTVETAAECGFLIRNGECIIAALSTAAEVADWIEHKISAYDAPKTEDDPLPRIAQAPVSFGDKVKSMMPGR